MSRRPTLALPAPVLTAASLLAASLLIASVLPAPAHAAPAQASATTALGQARAQSPESLWAQGKRAYQSGDHPTAARLLSKLLSTGVGAARRSEAEQLLNTSEDRVGRLQIQSDTVGTEILVDGHSIGRTPLLQSWYVLPGEHIVEARARELSPQQSQVVSIAGASSTVAFRLQPPAPLALASLRAAKLMGTEAGQRPPTDKLGAANTLHTVLLAATGSAALIGLATGIGFRVSATNREAEARTLQAQLLTIPEPSRQPCSTGTVFDTDCKRLNRLHTLSYNNQRSSERAFLVFGAAGVITLAYAFWVVLASDTPPAPQTRALVTPNVTPQLGGLEFSVSASF